MKNRLLFTAAVCCISLAGAVSCASQESGMTTGKAESAEVSSSDALIILDRIREPYLANQISRSSLDTILNKQKDDGSWPDIPYESRQRSSWEPVEHMTRIRHIAAAGYTLGWKGEQAQIYADAVNRAFSFWYTRKPKSDNWWAWTIGVPQVQAPAMTMCAPIIPEKMLRTIYDDLREAGSGQETWTGTNRTWIANNNLTLGLLIGDRNLTNRALSALTEEIRVTTDEGLQSDWSYHQHGPMLQTGNYGNSYLKTQTDLVRLLAGTSLAVPPEKVRLLTNYVLEHVQWVIWGTYFDIAAAGRQLDTPDVFASKARSLIATVKILAPLDPDKQKELEAVVTRYENAAAGRRPEAAKAAVTAASGVPSEEAVTAAGSENAEPIGARYWWRSDYQINRTADWTASLKMHSSRIMRVETWVNDENKLGLFANDGALWIRVRGDEQENLQPLLDWRRIPGVTGIDTKEPVPSKPKEKEYDAYNGGKSFVGGVSHGKLAAAAMDFSGIGVTAKKAWFFTPEAVICLGTDIRSTDGQKQLFTAVNQTFRKGELLKTAASTEPAETAASNTPAAPAANHSVAAVSAGASNTPAGKQFLEQDTAIWHDSIGYIFPKDQHLSITSETRTGSWKNLRTASKHDKAEGTVLQIEILHPSSPSSYEYTVVPGVDVQNFAQTSLNPAWHTLINTKDIQAVANKEKNTIMAVIWKAGTYSFDSLDSTTVTADAPCMLILSEAAGTDGSSKTLYVSDPTQKLDKITVTVNSGASYQPNNRHSGVAYTVKLPRGGFAGSTVKIF